jgi:hypothetical protein
MKRKDWRPRYLGPALYDLAEAAEPDLTREDFGVRLKRYLEDRSFSLSLDREIIDSLYKRTYYYLQLQEALPKMRAYVKSRDWKHRNVVIRSLLRNLLTTELEFKKYRNPKLPLTDMLVRSVISQIKTLTTSLKEELRLAVELIGNAEKLVSGYLKPQLESQFMLEINDHLAQRLPSLNVEERLLIIAGCVTVANILPPEKDKQDLHDLVSMRIHRARQAFRRDSLKYGWEDDDD